MNWIRFRRVGVRADDLLHHFQVLRPPVPVSSLVRRLGVSIVELEDSGWSGAADSKADGRATIFVRAGGAPPSFTRFTLAHELGHLLLHPAGVAYRDDSFRGTAQESEANAFAADLLMPLWMLEAAARKGTSAARLARSFEVSEQAMDIRLGRLVGL